MHGYTVIRYTCNTGQTRLSNAKRQQPHSIIQFIGFAANVIAAGGNFEYIYNKGLSCRRWLRRQPLYFAVNATNRWGVEMRGIGGTSEGEGRFRFALPP